MKRRRSYSVIAGCLSQIARAVQSGPGLHSQSIQPLGPLAGLMGLTFLISKVASD